MNDQLQPCPYCGIELRPSSYSNHVAAPHDRLCYYPGCDVRTTRYALALHVATVHGPEHVLRPGQNRPPERVDNVAALVERIEQGKASGTDVDGLRHALLRAVAGRNGR